MESTTSIPPRVLRPADCLTGGGEMGALMRAFDWATTPVGPVSEWPQSLRTSLSILLETQFPMYIAWGAEFTQFYNDGYRPILGSTKHPAALGKSSRESFAEIWHIIGPMFAGVLEGTSVGVNDFLLPLNRHGFTEECYFIFSYSPIRQESGGVGGVLVTVTETTERVYGERRLRTLHALGEQCADARTDLDACGRAAAVLADNAADLPFTRLYVLEPGAASAVLAGQSGTALSGASPERVALGAGPLLEQFAWLEAEGPCRALPLSRRGQDAPYGVLVAGISRQQQFDDKYARFLELVAAQLATAVASARAYEEERRRAEALAEIDRAKTAFFSNVSHEFRTPLTLMLGPIEDGLADTTNPIHGVQRERQELVRRNGLRLQKLVNTLLDFARIEAGRAQASFVPTELAALTRDLASSFQSAIDGAGLQLVIDCPTLPEAVYVDPSMWEKIVLNLISNAFKFTFDGEVRIVLRWHGDHVELGVHDTGTGIPRDELPKIFDRFHRVEGARGRSHEGTGIGLALVRDLVKLHGGTVDVESRLGAGTVFRVRVPAGSAELARSRASAEPRTLAPTGVGPAAFLSEVTQWNRAEPPAPAVSLAAAPATAPAVYPGARVLVADDNADMRAYIARLLSSHWQVDTVNDGAQALAAALAQPPDLIVSDVMMPILDGLALTRALRADARTRTIPIILLSARAGEAATVEGLRTGASDYLVKPFSASELFARVSSQLMIARLQADALRAEREHAEQTRRLLVAAQHATRAREEILATVSHDLRSPLQAIELATQLLDPIAARDDDPASQARAGKQLATIRRSTSRMDRLISDLLDLASIDAGTLAIEPSRQRVESVVREVHEQFEPLATARGIVLASQLGDGLPELAFDRERVAQALGNLLTNAIKFTPAGGSVIVRAELVLDAVHLAVHDTGAGIDPALLPHVFERYRHSAQPRGEGHGLGLAITRGIVEAHGGTVHAQSAVAQGSVFTLILPVDPVRPERAAPEPRAPQPDRPDASSPRAFMAGGEMGALMRSVDWSSTVLGDVAGWPQSLCTAIGIMLESTFPMVVAWGPEFRFFYNDRYRPILGHRHPDALGAPARKIFPEPWSFIGPLFDKTRRGEAVNLDDVLIPFDRNGYLENLYFTLSYSPIRDESGAVGGMLAVVAETSARVAAERRLATLRDLARRTSDAKTLDQAWATVMAVLGQNPIDVPFALLYVPSDAGRTARLVASVGLPAGAPGLVSEIALDLDEEERTWPLVRVARSGALTVISDLAARFGPLPGGPYPEPTHTAVLAPLSRAGAEQPHGYLVAGVSPRRAIDDAYRGFFELSAEHIATALANARSFEHERTRAEKLAELDRAKTVFFSNVSHELRTPLTLILGPVEDALASPVPSLGGDQLDLVRRNALRLFRMVNTLLDFSRMEAGRAQATFVPIDLAAFTADLASAFRSAAENAGLTLVVDCASVPEAIYVDPEMWEKIVFNLLSNALKYTYKGEIGVSLRWLAEHAVLTVRDSGVGIPAPELPRIFDRFYRARATDGRSHEGTGIGLALVHELAKLHGGSVEVESVVGRGTTFTVRVPRGSAHLASDRLERTPRPRSSGAGAAAFLDEARRWAMSPAEPEIERADGDPVQLVTAHILLADDSADLRAYVAGLLRRWFTRVEAVADGRTALDTARLVRPDLIVSDVMMPGLDGFELVRELRGDERTRTIPVILLSARAGEESTVEGLASGADDYLIKPFSARELIARVRTQLEMSRVRADVWRERTRAEALTRSVEMRDSFLEIVAHELRTPLTALGIQLERLLRLTSKGTVPGPAGNLSAKVEVAIRQTDRLTALVESLLDVATIAMGKLELVIEPLDLADAMQQVIRRFEPEARSSGSRFHVETTAVRGRWDRHRIERVFSSLVSNAIKYAPGTQIDVSVASQDGAAQVVVRDVGMGIAADQLGRVFDRFERGVSSDHYGGFGIGLYLARKIVEAHAGTIRADSVPGHGATFTITLPCEGRS